MPENREINNSNPFFERPILNSPYERSRQNLLEDLTRLLEKDDRLVSEGKLLKNKVVELALALDPGLLKLLLKHTGIKKHFFSDVDGVMVFDKIKFQAFVSNKQFLPDSYTAFKNKIGLTVDGEFLSYGKAVALAWPYKDCLLEGGQAKEETKRDELFWNEILAPDQIDRLLAPKALTNFKEYTKSGARRPAKYSPGCNLIIRGNNLLALHTLKRVYANQVKLIYIDPPFNTGADSFKYNDSFNRSTWLTFMKNRLEAAKDLLKPAGSLFVHLDDNEVDYCRVVLDEVFGPENFISRIAIDARSPSAFSTVNTGVFKASEYLLWFAKDKSLFKEEGTERVPRDPDYAYNKWLQNPKEDPSRWKLVPILDVYKEKDIRSKHPQTALQHFHDFILDNADRVCRLASIDDAGAGQAIVELKKKSLKRPGVTLHLARKEGLADVFVLDGQQLIFYTNNVAIVDGKKTATRLLTNIWADIPWEGIANEGGVKLKSGKKPEKLLKRIIEIATKPGELVVDFFAGSGTTLAVAHKARRQYIGIEQLDYQENDVVTRLKNVIAGDQTGVSKSLGWTGGGSFLYCELAPANELFVREINAAKSAKQLREIFLRMQERAFLSYRFDSKHANWKEFDTLSLKDQKSILTETLDKNMLYIPLSEIDDATYNFAATDKDFNRQFFTGS